MKQLLEAGVHFGHQTSRWNPKMRPYIFGARNGIHIIDLQKTVTLFREACDFLKEVSASGGTVLFVGTKKQAQDTIRAEAERCGMPYVNHRWLGGTLTNFHTIKQSLERLKKIEETLADSEALAGLKKKERLMLQREHAKLLVNLQGIREMKKLADALFVIDPDREAIAVAEANRLKIPVVAVVDTNCDPDRIAYCIPGNDDAIRAIRLFCGAIADAILEGAEERLERERAAGLEAAEGAATLPEPADTAAAVGEASATSGEAEHAASAPGSAATDTPPTEDGAGDESAPEAAGGTTK